MIRVPIGFRVVSALVVVAAFAAGAPARAQVNLIYNAIQPCRLIDTRVMGGPLAPGVARTCNAVGVGAPAAWPARGATPTAARSPASR